MSAAVQVSDKARAIYRSSLVWDMTVPYGMQHATDGITLPRFMKAGFGLVSLTLGGDKTFGPEGALANISKVYAVCAKNPDLDVLVRGIDDVDRARKEGVLSVWRKGADHVLFHRMLRSALRSVHEHVTDSCACPCACTRACAGASSSDELPQNHGSKCASCASRGVGSRRSTTQSHDAAST